ncbi:MAG: AEC family transporter [Proteobacteria bacterium]|nr:AEC family transporter [Pseudomonadota bacterium]
MMVGNGLVMATFESIATLIAIGLIGFMVIKRKVMPEETLGFLTPLAIDIALPCLIFVNILEGFDPSQKIGWWKLPLWWIVFQVGAGFLTFIFARVATKTIRKEFAVSLFFQNGMFLPIAIITGIFGKNSPFVVTLILFTLFYPSFFFSTYHLFFNKGPRNRDWRKIINNILMATVAATLLKVFGIQAVMPDFLIKSLGMVGNMAIPVLILIIGGNIYVDFSHRGKIVLSEIIKFIAIKNLIYPVVMIGILMIIKPPYEVALMMIIQSAVPPITAIPIVVDRAGGDRNIANQFLFSSFIFSLVTIPLIMYLFDRFV